jgi:hypothetical protein
VDPNSDSRPDPRLFSVEKCIPVLWRNFNLSMLTFQFKNKAILIKILLFKKVCTEKKRLKQLILKNLITCTGTRETN